MEALLNFFSDPNQILVGSLAVLALVGLHRFILIDISKWVNEGDDNETKTATEANQEWRLKDKTRSTKFLIRAVFHHSVVKARKTLHGVGGLTSWCSSFILTVWMLATGGAVRGPPILDKVLVLAVCGLHMGFFTPYFQMKKMSHLGRFRMASYGFSATAVSFAMTANSIYARNTLPEDDDVDQFTKVCTILSLLCPLLAVSTFFYTVIKSDVYVSALPGIAYFTSLPFYYTAFLYDMYYGREALNAVYESTRVGDLMYFLNTSGTWCQLTTNVVIVMMLTRVFTQEQVHRVNGYVFLTFGVFSILLMGVVLGFEASLVYTLFCGLAFPFHWLFPIQHLHENRKELGIFVAERGGQSLGLGVRGTTKKQS